MDSINALFSWVHFGHPELLWFLLGVPLVTLTSLWVAIRRARAMSNAYGDEALVGRFIERVSVKRLVAKSLALTVSLALLALALARPVQDSGKIEFPVGSVNVMAIVDVSRSMAVPDYAGKLPKPYADGRRLDMAKYLLVTEVIGSLGYNRLGVVTYAGGPFPQAFVTDDMPPLKWVLDRAMAVGRAPGEGSDIAKAFVLAFQMLDLDAKKATRNVIILMSDGGNDSSADEMRLIIAELKKRNIDLIVVGLGKTTQSPIPVQMLEPRDQLRQSGKYYQVDGEVVTTRLEENYLLLLKNAVNGRYVRVSDASDFKMTDMVSRSQVVYKPGTYEYFPWLLLGSLVMLLVSMLVPVRLGGKP
ncbi:MAG: VWA domain-containing protein [Candidatus Obscuribacter sp.]|nr:VWA domain-containing protein [Candidatus Obscuribacter sp.]MBP6592226.1 VWA domain-containing protein [Candidatus Obscuribacter sp.]